MKILLLLIWQGTKIKCANTEKWNTWRFGGENFTKRHRLKVAGDLKPVVLENRNVFSERWKIGGRAFLPLTALIFPLLTFMNPFLYSNRYVSYPSSSVWFPRKEKEGRKGEIFSNFSSCCVV